MIGKRWIKELFNPKLKCKRKGHKWTIKSFEIRIPASIWIAEDWDAKRVECKRCGKTHAVHKVKRKHSYTGVRIPKSMWDEMDRNGYLILKHW